MLDAVRANRKTVTRRRLAPELPLQQEPGRYHYQGLTEAGAVFADGKTGVLLDPVPCPFGGPGNVLAVLEDPAVRLQIISLRAEQLHTLTDADAVAEGIGVVERQGREYWGGVEPDPSAPGDFRWYASPRAAFCGLLTSIYPTAWARNEWVWVVEFRRLP